MRDILNGVMRARNATWFRQAPRRKSWLGFVICAKPGFLVLIAHDGRGDGDGREYMKNCSRGTVRCISINTAER